MRRASAVRRCRRWRTSTAVAGCRATSRRITGCARGSPSTRACSSSRSTIDSLPDEGRAYGNRLSEAGVEVVYREYPGQIHAFVSLTRAIPQGMAATLEIAEYLRKRLA